MISIIRFLSSFFYLNSIFQGCKSEEKKFFLLPKDLFFRSWISVWVGKFGLSSKLERQSLSVLKKLIYFFLAVFQKAEKRKTLQGIIKVTILLIHISVCCERKLFCLLSWQRPCKRIKVSLIFKLENWEKFVELRKLDFSSKVYRGLAEFIDP